MLISKTDYNHAEATMVVIINLYLLVGSKFIENIGGFSPMKPLLIGCMWSEGGISIFKSS